jgi:hypothetical protein
MVTITKAGSQDVKMVKDVRMVVKLSIEYYLSIAKKQTSQRPFSVRIIGSRLRSWFDRNVGTACGVGLPTSPAEGRNRDTAW